MALTADTLEVDFVTGDGIWARPDVVERWQALLDVDAVSHVFQRPEVIATWLDTVGAAIGA